MTMQFQCDCCHGITEVPQWGRTIYTQIEEHGEDGVFITHQGQVLHSCPDCNARVDVGKHLKVELECRCSVMGELNQLITR